MKNIKKSLERKSYFKLALVYTIFITIAFLSPSTGLSRFSFTIPYLPIDKLVHFILHAILLIVWLLYYWKTKKNDIPIKNINSILFACIGYGIIIEILQHVFVPSRQADLLDIFANILGAFVGLLLFLQIKNRITS